MKKLFSLMLCLLFTALLTGCVKTYTYQVKREDQDLVGNRGVMKGNIPPPEIGRVRTRTMGGMDVELPASEEYKRRKKALERGGAEEESVIRKKVVREEVKEVTEEIVKEVEEEESLEPEKKRGYSDEQWVTKKEVEEVRRKAPPRVEIQPKKAVPEAMRYTVQKGDSLGKIAKKFLGKSSRWSEIFEANRDTIKEPSKIYPGQVILIPSGGEESATEPVEYK